MRTTIDKAGRVVIPVGIRERAGLLPGAELEITEDGLAVRLERVAAGPKLRIYDSDIAEIARVSGARVVVTDNRRHFISALRYDLRVETPSEFLDGLRPKPRT